MRRGEKEIKEKEAIESIIRRSLVCRLGLADADQPYVVPLCFGYENSTIYFHGALEGRRIDIIRKNANVCCEFEAEAEVMPAEEVCQWAVKYQSVIAFGKAAVVESTEGKTRALAVIMRQYSNEEFQFPRDTVEKTAVIKVDIESMTGKQSGQAL